MVAVKAAGIDLDRRGAAARTGALDRLACRLVHFEEIIAIDLDRTQAETARASGDVMAANGVSEASALAVLVVFEDKDRRQFQHHRHVHCLEGGSLVRPAVTG